MLVRMITIRKKYAALTYNLPFKSFTFPGGELGVKLEPEHIGYLYCKAPFQTIIARLTSPQDFVELIMVTDALRRFDPTPIRLFMPYVPYARQDRVCVPGEAFAVKAFADVIKGLGFERITILDPHSDVTSTALDPVDVISQFDIVNRFPAFANRVITSKAIFVAPDAGSNKKVAKLAGYFNHEEFIRADKLRDLSNGNIKETIVYADDLEGRDVIIPDDIGDGCRTFIELAKVLKAKNAGKIILYVTHGIFSKGVDVIFEGGIDEIFTTDSFQIFPSEPSVIKDGVVVKLSNRLTVLNVEETFL